METYLSAPYTIDLFAPIPDEAPLAASTTPEQAAEISEKQSEFAEPMAGDLTLNLDNADLKMTATVELHTETPVRRVGISWGDDAYSDLTGRGTDGTYEAEHTYLLEGDQTVGAVADLSDGSAMGVAKDHWVGLPPVEPPPE